MKRFYQIFTFIFAAFAIVACSDPKADLQADVTAIEQITEQGESLKNIQNLQAQLASGQITNPADLASTFTQIGTEYTKIKDGVAALKLKTTEGKNLQNKFVSSITKFVELMTQTAHYSTNQPTPEQAEAFGKLQQEAIKGLDEASQLLVSVKQQLSEKK
ncbi:hypothetical protein [Conservatibacter flavescens]|uniref:Lipoprotein n=1 Tax=Conservatibacter flavescens TaxID=28161 RepID=A0A2M8S2V4_9PAST|nr:hypothetical protein [Conservatibacter flavescens]PJG85454.1 hypothetical protein CVP05_06135 [Conservatibacter flavescens]